ncbi:DUF6044 family protein [Sporomusa malonica]|uniref:Glucosyl transferase GtrII n=1 Tax=Sporomusa malonica TaxID=112901 RepID=A0A1W2E4L1_9FIRM|nr:DUF6044 family protein [Sporomusa malonica]SMD04256.1 hypothetical protein SAMN04488500_12031 [Sporomusa malonica]
MLGLLHTIFNFLVRHKAAFIFTSVLGAYLAPFIILRQNAHFTINDNLDWITAWTVLVNSGKTFDLTGTVSQMLGELPRSCLPSGFNIITWLYLILPPFRAYLVNMLLVHSTAFIGMFLLLRHYVISDQRQAWLAWAGAASFATIPFYTVYGLSIAGQPLLFYAMLNAFNAKKMTIPAIIIIIFSLYSSLPLVGVFILAALGLAALYDYWRTRQNRPKFWGAIALLAGAYCITEVWLIYNAFFSEGFVSSREEINRVLLGQSRDWPGVQALIMENFINGQYHAVSLHRYILFIAVPLALVLGWRQKRECKLIVLLLALALCLSVFYGLRYSELFMTTVAGISFFNTFQIQRFHWLHPLLWYTIFALSLTVIANIRYIGRLLAALILVLQLGYLFGNNIEYQLVIKEQTGVSVMENAWLYENISYGEFFADSLLKQVDHYIGQPKQEYRVASIGLYPAITQYNGFYTLDGRLNIYPLEYKHAFRQIMAKELDKNPFWQRYFDNWGITCYLFPAELEYYQVRRSYQLKLTSMELDIAAFKKLGGQYILSAAEITNYRENGLDFLQRFTEPWSPWEIYLYQAR